jgi:DNA-directed RNA polymerase subunit H (RpoH/RPB5)
MKRCITIEGDAVRLSLSNLGSVEGIEEIDLSGSDINDAEDIREVMETIDAYAQSGELDARTDIVRYTVALPDMITLSESQEDETEERTLTLDDIELDNIATDDIAALLQQAEAGDIVYLRREEGKGLWRVCVEANEDDTLAFDYIDCAALELGRYELLNEAYFAYLCDGILPESLHTKETKGETQHRMFEPRIVYGELYRVVEDGETWDKYLEKIDLPGHYFMAEEVESDELIDDIDA